MCCVGFCALNTSGGAIKRVFASSYSMPFYGLNPKEIVLRSEFCTSFTNSTKERKHNIFLASKSINGTLVDVNGMFSFNQVVGKRSVSRGYKPAKIIVKGKFVDGVGGGVCQVSTTLYNAVLLAGLKIVEYHPHSLPVSYIAPSFDAMVNENWADLTFINNTDNPILIFTEFTENSLKIKIFGEANEYKILRKSVIKEYIEPKDNIVEIDDKGEYPELGLGERKVLSYGKNGYSSEGYLIKKKDNKIVSVEKLRTDTYNPTRGITIEGTTKKELENISKSEE